MPDWREEIARRLPEASRDPDIVEEMAQHLDEQFAELRTRVGETRAREMIMAQIDDQRLREMVLSRRQRVADALPLGEPRRGGKLAGVWQDLRFGARSLARAPVFTLVAVVSLAVGIGATTAIFSLLHTVLLERLVVRDPDQLVQLQRSTGRGLVDRFGYTDFIALQRAPGLPRIEATTSNSITALIGTDHIYPRVEVVSGGFFDMLGIRPLLGRVMTMDDDRAKAPVVVISQDFWEKQLSGDPSVLGRRIHLEDDEFTVIGVLPKSYIGLTFAGKFDLAVSMSVGTMVNMPPLDDPRRAAPVQLFARMPEGQTPGQAGRVIDAAYQGCCALSPAAPDAKGQAGPLGPNTTHLHVVAIDASRGISNPKTHLREEYRQILLALMAGVSVLLLIACANVGNLLLARASARERELAVRISMGATRRRIVRQLLTESLELAVVGAILGAFLARLATSALAHNLPPAAQGLSDAIALRPSGAILSFTLGVTCVVTLLFGGWPALRATRHDIMSSLKEATRATGRRVLADRAVYGPRGLTPLIPQLLARSSGLAGVTHASISTTVPVFGGRVSRDFIRINGFQPSDDDDFSAYFAGVSPDFFATTGVGIDRGRAFTSSDVAGSERVAIVSRAFAKHFFNGRNPIGGTITLGQGADAPVMRIVGLARDAHYGDLREPPSEIYYAPLAQAGDSPTLVLAVRTTGQPSALGPALRHVIDEVAPGLRVQRLIGLEQAFDDALARERLAAALASLFGMVALGLAAVGLYGVVAYSVMRRTQEIGVRMALGARPSDALWLVVRQTLTMTLVGVAAGVPLSFLAASGVRAQLYGIAAHDPLPLIVASLLLVVVAIISSVVPARRAARVDPVVALRSE